MSKGESGPISVLGVCVEEPELPATGPPLDFCSVGSGRRAVEMLRLLSFDLVMVGLRLPDVTVWDFVRRVRTAWAWQKWALVAGPLGPLTEQQEVSARMLGAVAIYDDMPPGEQVAAIAARLRAKATASAFARAGLRPPDASDDLPPGYRAAAF